MMPTQHSARDGRRRLQFAGVVLGSATSKRGHSPRWSELVVYGLSNGSYIRSKIGRSMVVHNPDCRKVNHWMTSWIDLEDREESQSNRIGCIECQPDLRSGMNPHLMVETTRYTATLAPDAAALMTLLMEGKPGGRPFTMETAPDLVFDVIDQVRQRDSAFNALLLVRNRDAETVSNRPLDH